MTTDYDKLAGVVKELAIPAYFDAPLEEPKSITIGNDQQGTKAKFNFNENGAYVGVTFV